MPSTHARKETLNVSMKSSQAASATDHLSSSASDPLAASSLSDPLTQKSPQAAKASGSSGPSRALAKEEITTIDQLPGEKISIEAGEDAISASVDHVVNVSKGGVSFDGFGKCTLDLSPFENIQIVQKDGAFHASATLEETNRWDTLSGTGPGGQKDVESANDPDITQANYEAVASDLTPDMSDYKGRPPRDGFWAEDLTVRHEKYHSDDMIKITKDALKARELWLSTQSAANMHDVQTYLKLAYSGLSEAVVKKGDTTGMEERAYGDGAGSYTARAQAIRSKGQKGGYKADPLKAGLKEAEVKVKTGNP